MLTPDEILQRPYHWVFVPDEDTGLWSAYIEEFPGCHAVGDNLSMAELNLRMAAKAWINAVYDCGHTVPQPRSVTINWVATDCKCKPKPPPPSQPGDISYTDY